MSWTNDRKNGVLKLAGLWDYREFNFFRYLRAVDYLNARLTYMKWYRAGMRNGMETANRVYSP